MIALKKLVLCCLCIILYADNTKLVTPPLTADQVILDGSIMKVFDSLVHKRQAKSAVYQLIKTCKNAVRANNELRQDEVVTALHAALLARVLIERKLNGGATDEVDEQDFRDHYHSQCQPLLVRIDSQRQSKTDSPWQSDIEQLLDFAKNTMAQFDSHPYSYFPLSVLWHYHNQLEQHQLAFEVAEKAIDLAEKQQQWVALTELHNQIGTSLQRLGRLREYLFHAQTGLTLTVDYLKEEPKSHTYYALAHAYLNVGDYASAKRYYERVISREHGPLNLTDIQSDSCRRLSRYASNAVVQLGKIDRLVGNASAALDKHLCALQSPFLKGIYHNLGELEKAKDLAKLQQYKEAKLVAHSLSTLKGGRQSHKVQALLLMMSLDLQQHSPLIDNDIDRQIAGILDGPLEDIKLGTAFIEWTRLKMAYAALIKDDEGFNHQAKRGNTVIENFKLKLKDKDSWLSAQYGFVDDYVNSAYANQKRNPQAVLEDIIDVLDSHYALSFFDNVQQSHETTVKNQPLLKNQLNAEQSYMNATEVQRAERRSQLDQSKDIREAAQVAQVWQKTAQQTPALADHRLNEIQQKLAPDELLLRYFTSEQRSLVMVVTQSTTLIKELPHVSQIRQWVNDIKKAAGQAKMKSQIALMALNKLLPIALIEQGNYKKLIVIPDDMLHRLPFSAINLSTKRRVYEPLTNKMAVVRTHSIHDYLFGDVEQTRLAQNNNQIAVFADPLIKPAVVGEARSANALAAKEKPQTRAWNDTLERLPYSAREARNIESIFKKDQVNL
ncbi:MAG: CHAT domain-containing protein, partial [Psychrosphaera sp.]|nr:CHAT domain-containing protein [Psychrosphaera sp.]